MRTIRKNIGSRIEKGLVILAKMKSTEPQAIYFVYVSGINTKLHLYNQINGEMLQPTDDVIQLKLVLGIITDI